jgi:dihydrofolate reductase
VSPLYSNQAQPETSASQPRPTDHRSPITDHEVPLTLIVAYARNRVIGRGGDIPWKIKGEQAHFKRVTDGHPIVMGRKTWESLPKKPLPGRRNLVVSRDAVLRVHGAEVFASLNAALTACAGAAEIFVIGGAQIYALALPRADRVIATEIDLDVEGDAFFPPLPPGEWRETERIAGPTDEGQAPHDFVTYVRHDRQP